MELYYLIGLIVWTVLIWYITRHEAHRETKVLWKGLVQVKNLEEKRKLFRLKGVSNFEARDYIRALEEKIIELLKLSEGEKNDN